MAEILSLMHGGASFYTMYGILNITQAYERLGGVLDTMGISQLHGPVAGIATFGTAVLYGVGMGMHNYGQSRG